MKIFINYRRDDTGDIAPWLYENLRHVFGDILFIDNDKIRKGAKWRDELNSALESCELLIVLIGKNWLKTFDKFNRRRIDHPDDWVRNEIKYALESNKEILPIIFGGKEYFVPQALPEDISKICDRQYINFNSSNHKNHLIEVINSLENLGISTKNKIKAEDSNKLQFLTITIPPYSLLSTKKLIGRQEEIKILDNWLVSNHKTEDLSPMLLINGIGGMGKSALTWSWFNSLDEGNGIVGKFWWSFYHEQSFDDFLQNLYSFILRIPINQIKKHIKKGEEEYLFNQVVNSETKNLIVLDGLERILKAYQSIDTLAKLDSGVKLSDRETALASTISESDGTRLRELSLSRSNKYLISTRMIPSSLKEVTGKPISSIQFLDLEGLSNKDSLLLWYAMGMEKQNEDQESILLKYFNRFDNFPLIVKVLGGYISSSMKFRSKENISSWIEELANDEINPKMNYVQVRSQILDYALRDLSDSRFKLIGKISAFKRNVSFDMLWDLSKEDYSNDIAHFEVDLKDLIDRGLIGFDEVNRTFDIHPVVRGVVYSNYSQDIGKTEALESIEVYLTNQINNDISNKQDNIRNAELLHVLFHNYVAQKKYDSAYELLNQRLSDLLLSDQYYTYFMDCIDILFPNNSESKVLNLQSSVEDPISAIKACHEGNYYLARLKSMSHRLSCGNYYCEIWTALAGIDYSQFQFNEDVYQRILEYEKSLSSSDGAGLKALSFFSLELIERGYIEEGQRYLKRWSPDNNMLFNHTKVLASIYSKDQKSKDLLQKHKPGSNTFLPGYYNEYIELVIETTFDKITKKHLIRAEELIESFSKNSLKIYEFRSKVIQLKVLANLQKNNDSIIDLFAELLEDTTSNNLPKIRADVLLIMANHYLLNGDFVSGIDKIKEAYNLAYNAEGYSNYNVLREIESLLQRHNIENQELKYSIVLPMKTQNILMGIDDLFKKEKNYS